MCKREWINIQTGRILKEDELIKLNENSMLRKRVDLFCEWDFKKNDELGFDIFNMTKADKTRVNWICITCKSEYNSVVYSRTNGTNCPYCRNLKVNYTNCLATKNPKLSSEWHPTKNNKTPREVPNGSAQKYWWKCELGHEWEAKINKRVAGQGCPYCSGHKTWKGFNDINTTHPHIAKYALKEDDRYKYSKASEAKINWKCLECENILRDKAVKDIVRNGFSCPLCNDGFKKPEKIMISLLNHLNLEFKNQKTFEWSDGKIYDFYIELNDKKYIIETHGSQHYKQAKGNYGKKKTLKEEQDNDKYKYDLAMNNGIDGYVIIDCRNSDFEYIKNSIIKSNFNIVYSIDNIDWKEVFDKSKTSMIIEACDIYNRGNLTSTDVAKELNVSISTAIKYLKDGASIGLCDYTPRNENSYAKMSEKNSRKVVKLSLDGILLEKYKSIKEASESVKVHEVTVRNCCIGINKSAKGFRWMYLDDYEENIKNGGLKIENKKAVKCNIIQLDMNYNYINEFSSMSEAMRVTGVWRNDIRHACNGKYKQAGGFKWMRDFDYKKYIKESEKLG